MIDWLIQSVTAHPALARGVAPGGLLSEREQKQLTALRIAKRRRDWLLGRWTAKHLLQAYIEGRTGVRPPLNTRRVANDLYGAPYVAGDWGLAIGDRELIAQSPIPTPQSLNLSISHCDSYALCALSDAAVQIGADIERVEPRPWQFVEDYFTEDEVMLVRHAPADQRDRLITAIWSAKEAALKALHLGLSVDTRSVICLVCMPEQADHWIGFDIVCDRRLLGLSSTPVLTGWWRQMSSYVLTLAATS
jgi:4'-phosphopantetheinyl transferase